MQERILFHRRTCLLQTYERTTHLQNELLCLVYVDTLKRTGFSQDWPWKIDLSQQRVRLPVRVIYVELSRAFFYFRFNLFRMRPFPQNRDETIDITKQLVSTGLPIRRWRHVTRTGPALTSQSLTRAVQGSSACPPPNIAEVS